MSDGDSGESQDETPAPPEPVELTAEAIRKAGGGTAQDIANLHRQANVRNEELSALKAQVNQITQTAADAEARARLSGLPDDERVVEEANIRAERAEARVETLNAEKAESDRRFDILGRLEAAKQIGEKHGVDPELLMGLATPDSMEAQAKKIQTTLASNDENVKTKVADALKAAGIEPAEEEAAPNVPRTSAGSKPSAYDAKEFEHTGDLAGSLRAQRQAGVR